MSSKKGIVALAIMFLLISIGCSRNSNDESKLQNEGDSMANPKKVSFQTKDGVAITGNYWKGWDNGILLLHMMPATKESWNDFAGLLNKNGFSVFAIDLRGHGESTKQGSKTLDYGQFSDAEHQASIQDVESAVDYLKQQGMKKIDIAGASIGANLALWQQSEHPEIKKAILLSAGTNYRGIMTIPLAEKLDAEQQVFFAAGTLDGRAEGSASQMAEEIAKHVKGQKEIRIYETASHGTDLFNDNPELMEEIVEWLKK